MHTCTQIFIHRMDSEHDEDPICIKMCADVCDGLRSVVIYVTVSVKPDLWGVTAGCISCSCERAAAARQQRGGSAADARCQTYPSKV